MNKVILIAVSVLLASGCSNSNVNPEDVTTAADGGGGTGQPQFDDVPGGQPALTPPTTEDTDNILATPEGTSTLDLTPARLLNILNGSMIPQLEGFASDITTSGTAASNPITGATFVDTDTSQTPAVNNFTCDAGGKLSYDETDATTARTYTLEDCVLNGSTFKGKLIHTPGSEHQFSNFSAMKGTEIVLQVEGTYGEKASASRDSVVYSWSFPFYSNPDTDLLLRGSSMRETLSSTDGCDVLAESCAATWEMAIVLDLVTLWSNSKPLVGSGSWTSADRGNYTQGTIEATTADGGSKITLDADNGDPANFSSVVVVDGVATSEVIDWSATGITCRTTGGENIQLHLCK